jgi:hypothetical protein
MGVQTGSPPADSKSVSDFDPEIFRGPVATHALSSPNEINALKIRCWQASALEYVRGGGVYVCNLVRLRGYVGNIYSIFR